ncbi:hypothetical protein [Parapedobacter luteus]|uniref:hypothetical protein n=1 Tax=Parapedobacter luteus TaxID=623280 RepID=UPI0009A7F44F|nr:hypothetical protein [Parapedobacter luteus]
MAKVLVILLTCIYAFSATGATVHLHYCCGELQKLAIQHEQEKPEHQDCPLCLTHDEKKEADAACCGDDSCDNDPAAHPHCQHVKVEAKKTTEEHLPGGDKNVLKIHPLELLVFTLVHINDLPPEFHHSVRTIDEAPPHVTVPLFIQHCTYRI